MGISVEQVNEKGTKDTGPRPRDEFGFYTGRRQDDLASVDIKGPWSAVSATGRRLRARTVDARRKVAGVIKHSRARCSAIQGSAWG